MFLVFFGVLGSISPMNDDLWGVWDAIYLVEYGLNVSHFLALINSKVMLFP